MANVGKRVSTKKPLKQPKKSIKEMDEDDVEYKKKQKDDEQKLKEMTKRVEQGKGFVKKLKK